ncbi:hypothetical protein OSTOST_07129 [Ostertagia ostertagi]
MNPTTKYESFVVVALYMNVDTQRAVEACTSISLQLFLFLLSTTLKSCYEALAIGSRLATLLAVVFMDSLEMSTYRLECYASDGVSTTFSLGDLGEHCNKHLETDRPAPDRFLPFLVTKIKITDVQHDVVQGTVSKNILIYARICHLVYIKLNLPSSTNLEEVETEVDEFLRQNGCRLQHLRLGNHLVPLLVLLFIIDLSAKQPS